MNEASIKNHRKSPAEMVRGKVVPAVAVVALGLAAVKGGHESHSNTPDEGGRIGENVNQIVTANVDQAAESHPGQFRGHKVTGEYETAGSIAKKYAAPGDYNFVVREVTDQQNGAVLGQGQEVFIEKDLLADPNADGLHKLDSGSAH